MATATTNDQASLDIAPLRVEFKKKKAGMGSFRKLVSRTFGFSKRSLLDDDKFPPGNESFSGYGNNEEEDRGFEDGDGQQEERKSPVKRNSRKIEPSAIENGISEITRELPALGIASTKSKRKLDDGEVESDVPLSMVTATVTAMLQPETDIESKKVEDNDNNLVNNLNSEENKFSATTESAATTNELLSSPSEEVSYRDEVITEPTPRVSVGTISSSKSLSFELNDKMIQNSAEIATKTLRASLLDLQYRLWDISSTDVRKHIAISASKNASFKKDLSPYEKYILEAEQHRSSFGIFTPTTKQKPSPKKKKLSSSVSTGSGQKKSSPSLTTKTSTGSRQTTSSGIPESKKKSTSAQKTPSNNHRNQSSQNSSLFGSPAEFKQRTAFSAQKAQTPTPIVNPFSKGSLKLSPPSQPPANPFASISAPSAVVKESPSKRVRASSPSRLALANPELITSPFSSNSANNKLSGNNSKKSLSAQKEAMSQLSRVTKPRPNSHGNGDTLISPFAEKKWNNSIKTKSPSKNDIIASNHGTPLQNVPKTTFTFGGNNNEQPKERLSNDSLNSGNKKQKSTAEKRNTANQNPATSSTNINTQPTNPTTNASTMVYVTNPSISSMSKEGIGSSPLTLPALPPPEDNAPELKMTESQRILSRIASKRGNFMESRSLPGSHSSSKVDVNQPDSASFSQKMTIDSIHTPNSKLNGHVTSKSDAASKDSSRGEYRQPEETKSHHTQPHPPPIQTTGVVPKVAGVKPGFETTKTKLSPKRNAANPFQDLIS